MTLEEAHRRLNEIEDNAWDDESAHGKEDALMRDFIASIGKARSLGAVQAVAEVVLSTQRIGFSRWCA